eukprot:3593410-Karenia_brevis.AAC.1
MQAKEQDIIFFRFPSRAPDPWATEASSWSPWAMAHGAFVPSVPGLLVPDRALQFLELKQHCVVAIMTSRDPMAYISWTHVRKEIEHKITYQTKWMEADDLYVPYDDYVKDQGDPLQNGKGHRIGWDIKGRKCVIMPESNCMRRRKETVDSLSLKRKLDESEGPDDPRGDDHLDQKFKSLSNVCLMEGTGVDSQKSILGTGMTVAELTGGLFAQCAGMGRRAQKSLESEQAEPMLPMQPRAPQSNQSLPEEAGDSDTVSPLFGFFRAGPEAGRQAKKPTPAQDAQQQRTPVKRTSSSTNRGTTQPLLTPNPKRGPGRPARDLSQLVEDVLQ